MNAKRKLIPAVALLLISAIMLSTASYAWFTANNTVKATGMTVNATADASLVIKGVADSAFTALGTTTVSQTQMKPCTSFDGETFGKLADNIQVPSAANFAAVWTGTEGAFDPDDLQTTTDAANILTATYTVKSIAAACDVYVKDFAVTGVGAAILPSLRMSVTMDGTTLIFNIGAGTATTVGKYAASAWSLDTPVYIKKNTAAAKIGSLTQDTETTVTIKIWFEGQDSACFTDNVTTNDITVTVDFTSDATHLDT